MSEFDLLGTRIGHIRIVDVLGKGGMGSVYVGFDEKLERRVALKAIGHDKRLDVNAKARFLREARVLSKLEHPNICQIHDFLEGDENDFLVLELIKGTTLRQKLKDGVTKADAMRFGVQITEVLQAAHAMGVVHRDLKPANIMVTDAGEVKVLDFGLSRLVADRLGATLSLSDAAAAAASLSEIEVADDGSVSARLDSDGTDYTETKLGTVIGTLSYMSPEQARGEAAGPASDMYSFGLVLHEMFTNSPPYEKSDSAAVQLTRARSADTRPLTGLGGDLREVIGRLESLEPGARPSAQDAREHLERIRDKPKRRAKQVGVAAAIAILFSFSGVMAFQSARIAAERDRAETALATAENETAKAKAINEFLKEILGSPNPYEGGEREVTVLEALAGAVEKIEDRFEDQPEIRAGVLNTIGVTYRDLSRHDEAEPLIRSALDIRQLALGNEHPDVAESLNDLAVLLHGKGDYEEAEPLLREALAVRRKLFGDEHPDIADSLNNLAALLNDKGEYEAAEPLFREALAVRRRLLGDEHPDVADSLNELAVLLHRKSDYEAAELLYREALAMHRKLLGDEHPEVATDLNNLAVLLADKGDYEAVEPLQREALAMNRKLLGDEHPAVATNLNNLAGLLNARGDYEGAEPLFREALAMWRKLVGDEHPDVATNLTNLALLLHDKGDYEAAEPLHAEAVEIFEKSLGVDHWLTANARGHYGTCLTKLKRFPEAAEHLLAALPVLQAELGEQHDRTQKFVRRLADLYEAWNKPEKAAEYRALLEEKEREARPSQTGESE